MRPRRALETPPWADDDRRAGQRLEDGHGAVADLLIALSAAGRVPERIARRADRAARIRGMA